MRALLQSLHRRRSATNTNSRARTRAPERIDPATPPYVYRLETDKNLKNEIIALITCVITLQLTSHFFFHSQIELNLGKLHHGFQLLARYEICRFLTNAP